MLRRRAAGELINDAELDWPNIAEEIEDVGKSQRQAVESHLILALLHDLKGIVNLTSCSRILGRSMEHDAFMLPSGRTSPGSKP
jgi:hypothetical protein